MPRFVTFEFIHSDTQHPAFRHSVDAEWILNSTPRYASLLKQFNAKTWDELAENFDGTACSDIADDVELYAATQVQTQCYPTRAVMRLVEEASDPVMVKLMKWPTNRYETDKELAYFDYYRLNKANLPEGFEPLDWYTHYKKDGKGGFFFLGVPEKFNRDDDDSVTLVWTEKRANGYYCMFQSTMSIDYTPLAEKMAL